MRTINQHVFNIFQTLSDTLDHNLTTDFEKSRSPIIETMTGLRLNGYSED